VPSRISLHVAQAARDDAQQLAVVGVGAEAELRRQRRDGQRHLQVAHGDVVDGLVGGGGDREMRALHREEAVPEEEMRACVRGLGVAVCAFLVRWFGATGWRLGIARHDARLASCHGMQASG